MLSLYTTEDKLKEFFMEDGDWFKIITKLPKVIICNSSQSEEWDTSDPILMSLHRAQIPIKMDNELCQDIKKDASHVRDIYNPIYILDFDEKEAKEISEKYGIMFFSTNSTPEPPIAKRGWSIDTSDDDKEKTWRSVLGGIETPFHSLVIIDRYLFSKDARSSDTFDDSLFNIRNILDALLPTKQVENLTVSIIFDDTQAEYDLPYIATKVNKIKKSLVLKSPFNVELYAVNSSCHKYEDTHDRFIISNYFWIRADHKLKAYRITEKGNESIVSQTLTFKYLFSEGLEENDRSSVPMKTQDRIIAALRDSFHTSKNEISYAINGQTHKKGDINIKNELFYGTI